MTITGFLLSAIGGYLVGLVGSSNQPLSGLTLAALIIAALVMLVIGVKGLSGVAAVLGVAAVVCVACSVSGSLIQDLKAGQLLGGTPWKMELVEIISVILLSFFLMGPIIALHEANLATGGIGGRALPAPQAGLMAQLAKGIVGGQMAWGLLAIGAAFGVALLLCGARSPMLIAVGMYLPFDTSSAIFIGGLIKWMVDRARAQPHRRTEAGHRRERNAAGVRPDRRRSHRRNPVGRRVPRRNARHRDVLVLSRLGRLAFAHRLREHRLRADPHSDARVGLMRRQSANANPAEISFWNSRPLEFGRLNGLPVSYCRKSARISQFSRTFAFTPNP